MAVPSLTSTRHNTTYPALNPSLPSVSCHGKKVIITGASSGIGQATALAFAQAGARSLALLARRSAQLEETKKLVVSTFPETEVTLYSVDISDEAAVKDSAGKIGDWDVIVMNAGYLSQPEKVNVKGTFILAQAFLPRRKRDAVVIGTSTAALQLDLTVQAGFSAYNASKLAVIRLFEIMGAEYPDTHFVTFHPGLVETDTYEKSGFRELGMRTDQVELPAQFAVWLASRDAAFLRGKFVWTNWDVDELKEKAKEIQETPMLTTTIAGWPYQP